MLLVAKEGIDTRFSPSPFLKSSNLSEQEGVRVSSILAKQNIVLVMDVSLRD